MRTCTQPNTNIFRLLTNCKIRETNVMAYTFVPAVIHKIKLNYSGVFVLIPMASIFVIFFISLCVYVCNDRQQKKSNTLQVYAFQNAHAHKER